MLWAGHGMGHCVLCGVLEGDFLERLDCLAGLRQPVSNKQQLEPRGLLATSGPGSSHHQPVVAI